MNKLKKGWNPHELPCRCPICTGRVRIAGYNDVFTLYPELQNQWSRKNTSDPRTVSFSVPVIWECHVSSGEWESDINRRVRYRKNNGFLSPFVTGHRVLQGFNDITTTHPECLEEWDYKKNHDVTPQEVTQCSHRKVWWLDELGRSYRMEIQKKCARGQGSPYSAGKLVDDSNSLAVLHPELAAQWDYNKNLYHF